MKQANGWQISTVVTTVLSLTFSAFYLPAIAASTTPQGNRSSNSGQASLQGERSYKVAQAAIDNCRRVEAQGGLVVRQQPSPQGAVVGVVPNGRNVTIQNRGANGWVPITAPLSGYVSAVFLKSCQQNPLPPANCRQVSVRTGLNVRREPSVNSVIVGNLVNNQRVTIANSGANGWVPITAPIRGYVDASYLRGCSSL